MEKYDVISIVGEGSYGLVMRCRHRESGQYVAIKKFLETDDDPTVRKMATREIRMLKKLRHENLVNMIEVFRRKKRYFLVFEYLEHTVLEKLETSSGGLGFVISKKYIFQVLRALNFIHSQDVIHRDIKPENILVSRLGVIKLCDFGFARPYLENETFTDYVATRWYRSPELLVGDKRYGKAVDIWAIGCLYSEMMSGEPLFPGESDIDQLFQIIRVLGKLNSRHQHLVIRNEMFKGMKQEQISSLHQLFPNWNRDCLDFLIQCLKMDSIQRPDTHKLLRHDLFVRDNFLDNFLIELRSKINQEMQANPLLKRIPSYVSGRSRNSITFDNKKYMERTILINNGMLSTTLSNKKTVGNTSNRMNSDEQRTEMGLLLLSSSTSSQLHTNPQNSKTLINENNHMHKFNSNLSSIKNYTSINLNYNNNQIGQQKQITNGSYKQRNNLVLKNNNRKYLRTLSAKSPKIKDNNSNHRQSINDPNQQLSLNNFDLQLNPFSPVQLQSLQPEITNNNITTGEFNHLKKQHTLIQKCLSPINIPNVNNIPNPQYFIHKKSSNILALQQTAKQQNKSNIKQTTSINPSTNTRTNLMKRDKGALLNVGLISFNRSDSPSKDISPRVLASPSWLTANVKVTSHGKVTQIGKCGVITDWKVIGDFTTKDKTEILLPNCPGASSTNIHSSVSNPLLYQESTIKEHYDLTSPVSDD